MPEQRILIIHKIFYFGTPMTHGKIGGRDDAVKVCGKTSTVLME